MIRKKKMREREEIDKDFSLSSEAYVCAGPGMGETYHVIQNQELLLEALLDIRDLFVSVVIDMELPAR